MTIHATDAALNHEPPVHELLEDPIAQLLMQMDGVERQMLDPMLNAIMQRIDDAKRS